MKWLSYIVMVIVSLVIGLSTHNSVELIQDEEFTFILPTPTFKQGLLEPLVDNFLSETES